MSYKKAENVLPLEIVKIIQEYIDGEYIYIPKRKENKLSWGSNTNTRADLKLRNERIYNDYISGMKIKKLAEKYFLSPKSIERIILNEKRKCMCK